MVVIFGIVGAFGSLICEFEFTKITLGIKELQLHVRKYYLGNWNLDIIFFKLLHLGILGILSYWNPGILKLRNFEAMQRLKF